MIATREIRPYTIVDADTALSAASDVIIPFTYTSRLEAGRPALSCLSTMAIDTALSVAELDSDSSIVIASERTHGITSPSTGTLMRDWVTDREVSDKRIFVVEAYGEAFNNTPLQLRALKSYLATFEYGSTPLAVAHDFHIERVRMHAVALGVPIAVTSIAGLLKAMGNKNQYPELEGMEELYHHEASVMKLARLHQRGGVLNLITAFAGPQIHDVVFNDQTRQYEAVLGWARWPLSKWPTIRQKLARYVNTDGQPEANEHRHQQDGVL